MLTLPTNVIIMQNHDMPRFFGVVLGNGVAEGVWPTAASKYLVVLRHADGLAEHLFRSNLTAVQAFLVAQNPGDELGSETRRGEGEGEVD